MYIHDGYMFPTKLLPYVSHDSDKFDQGLAMHIGSKNCFCTLILLRCNHIFEVTCNY